LLLYTDGITEAIAPANSANAGAMFGTDRLDELLLDCPTLSTEECLNRIRTAVADFCENTPPTDDQTLIAIRCV
jgi:serine phosphatase RsbU (regulator of sigma subunit)